MTYVGLPCWPDIVLGKRLHLQAASGYGQLHEIFIVDLKLLLIAVLMFSLPSVSL